jgi:hypothetical protein
MPRGGTQAAPPRMKMASPLDKGGLQGGCAHGTDPPRVKAFQAFTLQRRGFSG